MANYHCDRCNKTMDENNFYTYKDGRKTELCKKCLTAHIDNFDPNTFLWLLEKMDVPYIPEEWNVLRDREYAKDPFKMNGMSVFGRYLSKMKLKQWKQYGWADSEKLQNIAGARSAEELEQKKKLEAEMKEALDKGEITEAQYKTLVSTETQANERPLITIPPVQPAAFNFYDENQFMPEEEMPDPAAELTKEDKLYLAMKWGRLYKPSEWIELEKHYNEMMSSFDIQDADTISTLLLLCKTDLKMNQAIDSGDLDGFQKLSKVSDSLRKSAKFTAAQNKEQKSDFVDSIGEFVRMCEKEEGFIPRYATDIPQDKVDQTLADMNNYLYKLVTQDLGFGQQIEDAIKKIQIQKEMNESGTAEADYELTDEDHEEFFEEIDAQRIVDEELSKQEEEGWL